MLTNITNINKKFIRMSERMILGLFFFVTRFNFGIPTTLYSNGAFKFGEGNRLSNEYCVDLSRMLFRKI